ncbi:hypothetical protein ACEWY4_017819 [Coilia grayii]|uniref:Ig-like domain-containing protein n=1 Tax=Coilia grayii TaxID=363190 RepID=A0ABD1JK73_9TELE
MTGKSGIRVSVTDLTVKETGVEKSNYTKVTCSASCSFGDDQYVWYKNGQRLQGKTTASILVSGKASYSCAVSGYEALRSPAVCIPNEQCWVVTYSFSNTCVLMGSSLDIHCTYLHPVNHRIKTTVWFAKEKHSSVRKDLCEDRKCISQTEYLGNKENNCTLRLKHITEGHSGEYGFRFTTAEGRTEEGLPGITISVTALQVLMTSETVVEGERVTLSCSTTCSLSNNPTFIWYKNGQLLSSNHTTRDNKLQLNSVSSEDSGNYSCAVGGHDESLFFTAVFLNVRYKPKSVTVSISASGDMGEGDTVTLTCSSDANPPVHNYTWYMKTGAESLVRGTGESISFNVTSDTSGLYYCQAQNEVGSQTSTEVAVQLMKQDSVGVTVILPMIITILLILVVLLILGFMYLRKKNAKLSAGTRAMNINTQSDPGLLYATVAKRTADPTQGAATRDQDDVQDASVQIKRPKTQTTPEEDSVTYASVQFRRRSAATRWAFLHTTTNLTAFQFN